MPNVKEGLLKRDYITVIIDGGVTGDSQWNWFVCTIRSQISRTRTDTGDKTITRIHNIYQKYPRPKRDDMMKMLLKLTCWIASKNYAGLQITTGDW